MPLSYFGDFGDDAQFGGADLGTLQDMLRELGVTTEDTEGSVTGLSEAWKGFVTQGRSLTALVEATNSGFNQQSALLGMLCEEAPELAEAMTGLFDRTTEGAESLNRAVAAVGKRFLDAFEGPILRGESLGPVLKSLARDLTEFALNQVKTGGLFGGGCERATA